MSAKELLSYETSYKYIDNLIYKTIQKWNVYGDIDDYAQECRVYVWQSLARYDSTYNVSRRNFVITAIQVALKHQFQFSKCKKRFVDQNLHVDVADVDIEDTSNDIEQMILSEDINKALDVLDRDDKELIVRRYFHEHLLSVLAVDRNCTIKTLTLRINKLLKILGDYYENA